MPASRASPAATAGGPAEAKLAANLQEFNLAGMPLFGPSQGFGQLWEKRFWVHLRTSPAPESVVATWKSNLSTFWPDSSLLVAERITEDEVVAADIEMPAGTRVTAGLVVFRSTADHFTLMTLRGHPFAARIRFAARTEQGATEVSVEMRLRAGDPIYEAGMLLGGHRREEQFWSDTLRALAHHFQEAPSVHVRADLIDRGRQWSRVTNLWYNAAIRTQIARVWSSLGRAWRALR